VIDPDEPRFPVGTNLNGLSNYSTELPFLDAFKTSSPWVSGTKETWNDGRPLDLDDRGWVRSLQSGQIAYTALFSRVDRFHGTLAPRYVVEYEGEGTLEYSGQAKLAGRGDHHDFIAIDSGAGDAVIEVTATDPNDYIRNIRVTPEDSNPSHLFNPQFIASLEGYRTLRFMIWMLGESSDDIAARTWQTRPRLHDARWTVKGAPIEVMVELANRVGADPWFTIPHAADDDYVKRFAETVRDSLHTNRTIYLEYSNEVWNSVYPQTPYARDLGLALGLSTDPSEALLRFYAMRSREVFDIWSALLSRQRLVRLLAFQFDGSPEVSAEVALSYADVRHHLDAISVGPYFGTSLGADSQALDRARNMNIDALMRQLEDSELPSTTKLVLEHASVARRYDLPLIAYEGGQHLWNMSGQPDSTVDALFSAANRDPRMGALYSKYLQSWQDAGGGLFVHLLDCANVRGNGDWGAKEFLSQPRADAPKYDAIQKWIEGRR
jgi:hypothetical protein